VVKKGNKAYNKYSNKKTIIDGYKFDSKKESGRYLELKLLQRAELIKDLELQPRFLILDTLRKNNKTFQKRFYVADFSYYDNKEKRIVVEDVKGFKTPMYKIKRHMFEEKYPDLWVMEI